MQPKDFTRNADTAMFNRAASKQFASWLTSFWRLACEGPDRDHATFSSPAMALRRVLVTGGNKGIGRALCRQLAADHGFYVLLGSRDPGRGEEAVKSILQQSPECSLAGSGGYGQEESWELNKRFGQQPKGPECNKRFAHPYQTPKRFF
eukprot:s47_g7.t1